MKLVNKSAPNKFTIEEKFEAGIQLLGSEVKAIRLGHADLASSYVKIMSHEAYLINARIFPYQYSRVENYQEDRTRKLLLHKKELLMLKNKLDTGKFTLTALSFYEKNGKFKVEIALSKGKKQHEMRKDAKNKAIERSRAREEKHLY